jgi:hypothetical protein
MLNHNYFFLKKKKHNINLYFIYFFQLTIKNYIATSTKIASIDSYLHNVDIYLQSLHFVGFFRNFYFTTLRTHALASCNPFQ